jgi:mono/diheme cytochrome c family protein
MSHGRQFGLWIAAAGVTVILLLIILRVQYRPTQARFALAVNVHPAAGRTVFEAKGCARCHGADAAGSDSGPSLRNRASLTSLPRLVTSLWNHVPRMSEAMQAAHMPYPAMSHDDTAQLLSFLFVTGLTDDPGDARRGETLFTTENCAVCHRDGSAAPSPRSLGAWQSPLDFTEALWNHAPAMQKEMQKRQIQWPRLEASDLRDLFAYARAQAGNRTSAPIHAADAATGWQLFQSKSCIECHALRGRESSLPRLTAASSQVAGAPSLPVFGKGGQIADADLPPTLSEFGAAMLNHIPKMRRAMDHGGASPPEFATGDLADIAVFLYSLHNTEPAGTPYVGASVFVWRGCSACHGVDATGGTAPALRGRGQSYTAIRLATGLWAHGERMYQETQRTQQAWPRLEDSDIGDLLAFLNTPPDKAEPAPPTPPPAAH